MLSPWSIHDYENSILWYHSVSKPARGNLHASQTLTNTQTYIYFLKSQHLFIKLNTDIPQLTIGL